MFGILVSVAAQAAVNRLHSARHEEQQIKNLPEHLQAQARKDLKDGRAERARQATEERRHREMVEATRERNFGPLGFIFGLIIGSSGK